MGQPDLGSAYRLAPQSPVSRCSGVTFLGGITVDIQTKEETKTNKMTIYMKSGHMTGGCVTVHDTLIRQNQEGSVRESGIWPYVALSSGR